MKPLLGEAKFYRDINSAIRDVVEELHVHTEIDYMRDEFILISGKVDLNWPHANQFKDLISNRKSLDTVFDNICIPVLLTYESNAIASHSEKCDEFDNALKLEFEKIYEKFSKNTLPDVRIHLFLIPLAEKCKLLQAMHSKLEGMQR